MPKYRVTLAIDRGYQDGIERLNQVVTLIAKMGGSVSAWGLNREAITIGVVGGFKHHALTGSETYTIDAAKIKRRDLLNILNKYIPYQSLSSYIEVKRYDKKSRTFITVLVGSYPAPISLYGGR